MDHKRGTRKGKAEDSGGEKSLSGKIYEKDFLGG